MSTTRFQIRDVHPAYSTVFDTKTGLIWRRQIAPAQTLTDAQEAVSSAAGDFHREWRIPTIAELRTLIVDPQNSSTPSSRDPALDAVFLLPAKDVHQDEDDEEDDGGLCLWSSTNVASNKKSAWILHTDTGSSGQSVIAYATHAVLAVCGQMAPIEWQVDITSGVVSDPQNGLMWQREVSKDTYTQDEAKAYIQTLRETRFAGYDNWRLPTRSELMGLVDYSTRKPAIDGKLFPKTPHKESFWTATRYPSEEAAGETDDTKNPDFWMVDFAFGSDLFAFSDVGYIRAVRDI